MKDDSQVEINVDSKVATNRIKDATRAAEKLQEALDKLKNVEIEISVVGVKKKWWQFWK